MKSLESLSHFFFFLRNLVAPSPLSSSFSRTFFSRHLASKSGTLHVQLRNFLPSSTVIFFCSSSLACCAFRSGLLRGTRIRSTAFPTRHLTLHLFFTLSQKIFLFVSSKSPGCPSSQPPPNIGINGPVPFFSRAPPQEAAHSCPFLSS